MALLRQAANNVRELATDGWGAGDDVRDGSALDELAGTEGPLLVTAGSRVEQGTCIGQHQHPHHLLAWARTATVAMRTGTRDWLMPPTHAFWVPAGTSHTVEVRREGHVCVVLLGVDGCPLTWAEPTGVVITPLVRELILHLDRTPDRSRTRAQAQSVLLDLLEPASNATFQVPLPTDPRARIIADGLLANPADGRDLAAWAWEASASVRTVTRLFADETGMTFARWRTCVRVRAALSHLARGRSVGATARAVGYRKPAAFSEAFQRFTGQHPGECR